MARGDVLRSQLKGEPPPKQDGRNIDPRCGALGGEGALQRVERLEDERPYPGIPEMRDSSSDRETYYGLPVLKEHVWKAAIPMYFYVGGLAGASAVLGAAADWSGNPFLGRLVDRSRLIAAGGAVVSAALLIEDLGRPSRFLNMLRVFRPTSPMNVGSWILSGFGGCAAAAALLRNRRGGPLAAIGDAAALGAGIFGLPLAGYTAVLLAGTAVPVWHGAATALPPLFVSSAITSAACALDLCELNALERRVVRRFGVAGKVADLFFGKVVERQVSRPAVVGAPLREGLSGLLWRSGKIMVASSLALSLFSRRSRALRRASGWLGTAGSLALRFGVLRAGRMSARDPRATFAQQRSGAVEATEPASTATAPSERSTIAERPSALSTHLP